VIVGVLGGVGVGVWTATGTGWDSAGEWGCGTAGAVCVALEVVAVCPVAGACDTAAGTCEVAGA